MPHLHLNYDGHGAPPPSGSRALIVQKPALVEPPSLRLCAYFANYGYVVLHSKAQRILRAMLECVNHINHRCELRIGHSCVAIRDRDGPMVHGWLM